MEGGVEGDGDERRGPDAEGRVDEEPATQTSQAVAEEVGGQGHEDLIPEADGPGLAKVLRQVLDPDDIVRIRRALRDAGHDGDEHVLFLVKRSRVQAMPHAEQSDSPVRQRLLHELSKRVGEKLGHVGRDVDGRLADLEEAVDEGDGAREEDADDPGAQRRAGHGRIVVVVDDGAHLGIGGVVRDEGGFDLHLADDGLVVPGFCEDLVVAY